MSTGPKRKISKSRRDKRRKSVWKLALPAFCKCPKCNELKSPHKVCKACGFYKGVEVLKVEEAK